MVDRPEGPTLTKTYGQKKNKEISSWIWEKSEMG